MQIEGRKNLELIKRALNSHLLYCSEKALQSDEKTETEKWDPELKETQSLLDAVEENLRRGETETGRAGE